MTNLVDSNVPWIGKIPETWSINPLFSVCTNNKTKNTEKNENVLSLSYGKIIKRDLSKNFGLLPENFDSYQIVEKGYVIIRPTDLQNDKKSLRVGLVKQKGIITSVYIGLSPNLKLCSKYLFYYLHMCDLKKVFYSLGGGLRQSLRFEEFRRFPVLTPPTYEQQKLISLYLDKKIEQIDSLIEKIQKKIELLKEQRTSLINQCVTKGLYPNVEMKDSGVEWIGQIPKHWEVTRLKYVCPDGVQYGLNIESDSYRETGIRFLRITDIQSNGLIKEQGVYLSKNDVPDGYYLYPNDILFSRSGGTVGKTTRISEIREPMTFAGYLVRFSFYEKDVSIFVKWVTESSYYWNWIDLQIIQSTIQNVNGEKYSNFCLCLPPLDEQKEINKNLKVITSNIDQLISRNEKKLDLLDEYRQSLISSVVTGKIRVTEDMI